MTDTSLPLMFLDAHMPETATYPIHPETGEVWDEKRWELMELTLAWRYESDEDLRKKQIAKYKAAKEGVTFEQRPLVWRSTTMLGAAYKESPPQREMYRCHPKTWERMDDGQKAMVELRQNPF